MVGEEWVRRMGCVGTMAGRTAWLIGWMAKGHRALRHGERGIGRTMYICVSTAAIELSFAYSGGWQGLVWLGCMCK